MNIEEGISLDFADNIWMINIVADDFSDLEKEYFTNVSKIYYHSFHLVSFFLVEIQDYLEISDVPFSIFEANDDIIKSLDSNKNYNFQINLMKTNGEIVLSKRRTSKKNFDSYIRTDLKEILNKEYSEAAFEAELERIYQKYDPQAIFELCDNSVKVNF